MTKMFNITHKLHFNKVVALFDKIRNYNLKCQWQKYYSQTTLGSLNYNRNLTLKIVQNFWKMQFTKYNIPEPVESIENILAHTIGSNKISDVRKKFDMKLTEEQLQKIKHLCELRLKRMPVQYIIGEWNFRDLVLKMRPPVFIPRPETEMLIDIILKDFEDVQTPLRFLEICCGSGAISLALLKSKPNLTVLAIDQSLEACQLATENATLLRLANRIFIQQSCVGKDNLLDGINGKFNAIVSNPPYVPSAQVMTVQPEIKLYEDLSALDGGADGLSVIKPILYIAANKLCPGGRLYLEIDPTHPKLISTIIDNNPNLRLRYLKTFVDFCKKQRFITIEKE